MWPITSKNDLLRSIDRFVDLEDPGGTWRRSTARLGRPSIDPELLIRMLLVD
jgi:hypothetical protein